VFDEFANIIRQRYPSLLVEGDNYPPPLVRAYLAQGLSILKLVVIVVVFSGQNPFPALNMNTPAVLVWAHQNKLYACMMTFFLSNMIEGQLISTGAFEVSFNDVPVWSKLENGRVPSAPELFQIIDTQMNMMMAQQTPMQNEHY